MNKKLDTVACRTFAAHLVGRVGNDLKKDGLPWQRVRAWQGLLPELVAEWSLPVPAPRLLPRTDGHDRRNEQGRDGGAAVSRPGLPWLEILVRHTLRRWAERDLDGSDWECVDELPAAAEFYGVEDGPGIQRRLRELLKSPPPRCKTGATP
jgi:hypothetical protein